MGYTRQMSQSTKNKIANSLRGRKLTPNHIKAISDGVKRAWSKIPQDPQKIYNNNTTKNDTGNGTKIKNEL